MCTNRGAGSWTFYALCTPSALACYVTEGEALRTLKMSMPFQQQSVFSVTGCTLSTIEIRGSENADRVFVGRQQTSKPHHVPPFSVWYCRTPVEVPGRSPARAGSLTAAELHRAATQRNLHHGPFDIGRALDSISRCGTHGKHPPHLVVWVFRAIFWSECEV